jgi:neurotransmitter:Na+ symporter, NSS family
MDIPEPRLGTWTSSRSFVVVAVGACVGMGNLVRLPELMSLHGTWPFRGVYLACILLVGLPLLMAEWMLGRWMRGDLVSGFDRLNEAAGTRRIWRWLGGMMVLTAGLVLSYYSVIAGWSLAYVFRMASGGLAGASEVELVARFLSLAGEPERGLGWHTIFMVTACVVVAHGFREGIEHAALRLVPASLLLALGLLVYLFWTAAPGESAALPLLTRSGPLTMALFWAALQESLITLSLGIGAMVALGVYLPAQTRLLPSALAVIGLDLLFALVLGLALALVLQAGEPSAAAGLGVIFQELPQALPPDLEGTLIGLAFYLLLAMMTLTSAVVLLETVTRYAMERWRLTRVFATTASAMGIWAIGVLSLLSFAAEPVLRIDRLTVFEALRGVTAQIFAPLAALLLCIYVGRLLPEPLARAAYGPSAGFAAWWWALRYPARLGAVLVLLQAFGILDWVMAFWRPGP